MGFVCAEEYKILYTARGSRVEGVGEGMGDEWFH